MAISVRAPYNYPMATAADAHAFFLALDGHLTTVGLTQGTTGSDYNVAGSSSQMPTTALGTSPWLVYAFTDTANATYPITVWFRMVFGYTGSSGAPSLRYVLQYRITEGQSGGTPGAGADFQCYDGISTPANGASATTSTYSGSIGDFVRYDGNSLTIIMGAGGLTSSYNGHNTSLVELHIERRYSVSTGLVGAGFTGWVPYGTPAVLSPPQYVAGSITYGGDINPLTRGAIYVSSGSPSNEFYLDGHTRPLHTKLLTSSGSAIAAPVFFMDPTHRPTPAQKLFTVPFASFTQGGVYTLDFLGVARPYLIYRPYTSALKASTLAFAIEWEV